MANNMTDVPVDFIRKPLYDTEVMDASAGTLAAGLEINFFVVPLGGQNAAAEIKTKVDTNSTLAGQVPFRALSIDGIRMDIFTKNTAVVAADKEILARQIVFQWQKEDRVQLELPIIWMPAGAGMYGATALGMPVQSNYYRVVQEVLEKGARLQMKATAPAAISGLSKLKFYFQCMLEGGVARDL